MQSFHSNYFSFAEFGQQTANFIRLDNDIGGLICDELIGHLLLLFSKIESKHCLQNPSISESSCSHPNSTTSLQMCLHDSSILN